MKKLNLFAAVTVALATTACDAPAEETATKTVEALVEEVMTEEELMDSTTEVIVINSEEAIEEEAL